MFSLYDATLGHNVIPSQTEPTKEHANEVTEKSV